MQVGRYGVALGLAAFPNLTRLELRDLNMYDEAMGGWLGAQAQARRGGAEVHATAHCIICLGWAKKAGTRPWPEGPCALDPSDEQCRAEASPSTQNQESRAPCHRPA